jgi:hypothetical protein
MMNDSNSMDNYTYGSILQGSNGSDDCSDDGSVMDSPALPVNAQNGSSFHASASTNTRPTWMIHLIFLTLSTSLNESDPIPDTPTNIRQEQVHKLK